MNASRIEFGIQTSTEEETNWLAFELLPGTFPQQWAAAFAKEVSRKSLWHFNFGSLFVIEPFYRNKIANRLKSLRQAVGDNQARISDAEISPYIKRKVLEAILQDCSEIKSAHRGKGPESKIADELSELVRHYLQIYHPEFHFHISLQAYLPQAYHLPKEALSLFTCDRNDGWLYLDYIGEGQDSLSCFNEKSVTDHEPQRFFSGNSQILYRENFDGAKLKAEVINWLNSKRQPFDSVGLIPLARPLHSFSRAEIRELFSKSNSTVKVRLYRDGVLMKPAVFEAGQFVARPYYSGGLIQAAMKAAGLGFLRITQLDRPVNFLVDWYHRYGVSLWIVKQPYHWLRPHAVRFLLFVSFPIRYLFYVDWPTIANVAWGRILYSITLPFHLIRPHAFKFYFAVSRPMRKAFYFAKFQFEKRILRVKK